MQTAQTENRVMEIKQHQKLDYAEFSRWLKKQIADGRFAADRWSADELGTGLGLILIRYGDEYRRTGCELSLHFNTEWKKLHGVINIQRIEIAWSSTHCSISRALTAIEGYQKITMLAAKIEEFVRDRYLVVGSPQE